MSYRSKIANSLVEKLKEINGSVGWQSDLYNNVENKLKFFDEVTDYPAVFVNTGSETREYQPGGFKWAYLLLTIRIYVKNEEPQEELELILEDIEKVIDSNGNLEYDTAKYLEDMKITVITTDEGLLSPTGVAEMTLQVMYDLQT